MTSLAPPRTGEFDELWNTRTASAADDRCLVPISPGIGSPIFCVHWASGNIRFIRETTRHWCGGRPILGFEAVGLYGTARPLLTVTEMADRYLGELRSVRPHGPYALVGLCSGSQIAYEMARRLAAAGEDIEVLAVVNGVCPGVSVFRREWTLRDIYELRLASLRRDFDVTELDPYIPDIIRTLKARAWIDGDAEPENFYPHQLLWAAGALAQDHYPAQPYGGALHSFRCSDVRGPGEVAWTGVAPRATTTVVDAKDSIEMLTHSSFAQLFA